MEDDKQDLRSKAEAYQRQMQEAHARRLHEEMAGHMQRLQAKAEDVSTLAAAFTQEAATERDRKEGS